MGAGPLPRVGPTDHPPRPPIPIVPVDDEAIAAARARGADELTAWLAGVTGAERPVVRVLTIGAESILRSGESGTEGRVADRDDEGGAQPALTVADVAHAVDTGRDLAATAAADGIALVIASAPAPTDAAPAISLIAALTGRDPGALTDDPTVREACKRALVRHPNAARGPLHALRRLGNDEIAVLCGVALGAGEHGLGCVCDGLAALAGAAVAAAIEPTLRPRLRAVDEHELAAPLDIDDVDAQELAAALD